MRRVACYAAESLVASTESAVSAIHLLVPIVESWLQKKGASALVPGRTEATLRGGKSATIEAQVFSTASSIEWDITVTEPTPSGRFLTRIVLGGSEKTLNLFVELRAGVGGYRLAPHDVDVRCPQVLRDILATRTWSVGKTPVSIKPIRWIGTSGAKRFLAVLTHEERNLPVVVVSEYDGRTLSPTLPDDLARDLSGLAIVVHLDESASWAITTLRGKEWSCFDGSIRVYWPIQRNSKSAYDHPYWPRARLIASAGSEAAASVAIRNELRKRLLELSTYAVDESVTLGRIRDDAARQKFDEMRLAAEDSGEQGALAEEWFNRCVELEAELTKKKEQVELLQDQVGSLSEAWKFTRASREIGLPPEPDRPVESVADAVNRARLEFPNELVFGEDVDGGVSNVASDAGPPDKVFEHLKTLAEMGRIRQSGPLGRNMIEWFGANGISASYESEFVRNDKTEKQKRTWHDGGGQRMFTAHLKPSDGTSPDRCIRIYFEYDDDLAKVIVGWVGRHP